MTIQQDIAKIYVGYFGRSPEPEGFNYWISEANRGFTTPEIAASFSVQQESINQYPYLANPLVADPEVFVNAVYQNLFNRDPDPDGLEFWVNELNEAQGKPVAVGAMVLNIISGAQNTEEFGPDKDIIENKTAVALDWAQKTSEISGFEYELGSEAAASAKSVLDEVDETEASVVAAKAETDAFIAAGGAQSGETFVLTSGVDGGSAFVGTVKNDTYIATDETLNTGDQLNGGGGTDTLIVQASGSSVSATPNLTSVENVVIQGGASNLKARIDFTTSTGVEMGMLKDVRGSVEFVGVSYPFDLSVQNSNPQTLESLLESATALSVNYTSGSVSGTEDVQKLELQNAGLANLEFAGIEHVEVVANGLNFVEFNEMKSLTVEGTGDLIADLPTGDTTDDTPIMFDSTASTGNMTVFFNDDQNVVARGGSGDDVFVFQGTTDNVDVNGGDGDDFFFFSDTLTEGDSVDGGEGKDTLSVDNVSSAPASLVNALSGLEVLQFEDPLSSSLDASEYDLDEFVFNGGPRNGQTSISGIESDDRFVFTSDQGSTDKTLNLTGARVGESFFMELRAAPNGSFTKDLDEVTDGNVEIVANTNSGNDVAAVYFNDNISSVTIASTGSNENANVIEAVDTGSENYFAFGNEDGPTSFKIVGEQALTVAAREGTDITSNSDQSGFEEAVNVDASEFEAVLRIALSNSADVFVGGSGDDIIYGLGGDDQLTGGGGADQFRYVGTNGTDTILDFLVGEDKIGFNEFDFENTTETFAGTTLASADYVDNRNGITEIGNADEYKVIELQQAFSTQQIQNDTGAAVEAYVLVFNSTTGKGEIWHDANWSNSGGRDHILTFDNVEDLVGVQGFSNTDFVEFVA